jgi:hypothetical protein
MHRNESVELNGRTHHPTGACDERATSQCLAGYCAHTDTLPNTTSKLPVGNFRRRKSHMLRFFRNLLDSPLIHY